MKIIKSMFKKYIPCVLSVCLMVETVCGAIISASAAEMTNPQFIMTYFSGGNELSANKNAATASNISGIRLHTTSSDYHLEYQTQNEGKGFYGAVNSESSASGDYAGLTSGRIVQCLKISVITGTIMGQGTAIKSGIVVMYRVKAVGNNDWMPWVSNADPEWMQSCKTKYNLSGNLDLHGSYAGETGRNITAVEVHVYEEDELTSSTGTFSGTESTDGFQYRQHGYLGWTSVSTSAETAMDCVKINTGSGKGYYFKYQTMNEGSGSFNSDVSSNDYNSESFVGKPNSPIQLLRIKAYSTGGAKLTSGIVVMYRTKADDTWLPWVSNADPEYMIAVQSQYSLGGTLDTHGSYAGKTGTNITGLEIRVFEGEIPVTTVTGMSGNEYLPAKTYRTENLNNWYTFNGNQKGTSTGVHSNISGLKIQTDLSKDYYLKYNVSTIGSGYLGEVSSRDPNNMAGKNASTPQIDRVDIDVYNSVGVKQVANVVVMYRTAYYNSATGSHEWYPWVSNANPEWMQSVLMKYHLDGTLDTGSGYAGSAGKAITNLEIRIFEENAVSLVTKPTGSYKIINTPYIYQKKDYPTACESVSTVMALQYSGVNVGVRTFIDYYLYKTPDTSNFDPNVSFGGNPYGSGYGCYAPVIKKACDKLLAGKIQYATELHNVSLENLCSTYIDNNIPVVLWATTDMKAWYYGNNIGGERRWIAPEHCLLLVGYDDYNYIFKDPQVAPAGNNTNTYYSKSQVQAAYKGLGSQAIVIRKGSAASAYTPQTAPVTIPSVSAQEYKKPSPVEENHCADPVDLSTGSHVIDNTLMSLSGWNNLTVTASYNSSQLVKGSMGVGWSFSYEKSLSFSQSEILVYETPSLYSRYVYDDNSGVYSCATKGKNNYKLTILLNGAGYSLDCNGNRTELYDASGKLVSVTDKQGFVTAISYSNNLITLTDTLTNKHIYLEKNAEGKVTRLYDDASRETLLIYSNDYLVSIKDVNGNYLAYTYTDSGRIETGTDNEGVVFFRNEYNAETGRIYKQRDGVFGSLPTIFNYSADGKTVTVTNRNGDNSIRVFDDYGQLVSYTDENGNTTTYSYDGNLNLLSTTDALGNTETIAYNEKNLPVSKTDKRGTVTLLSYDENGNITDVIYNPKGDVTEDGNIDIKDLIRLKKYTADIISLNNPEAADMNSDNVHNGIDLSLLRKCLLGLENICTGSQKYVYNERNQIISSTDLRGTKTDYAYDSNGLPLSEITAGRIVSYVYQNGLLMSQTDAKGNTTSYTYNAKGQMQTAVDAENNSTSYLYDNSGNLLSVTNSLGESVSYTYDGNGNKSTFTDAKGNKTFYSFTGNMKLYKTMLPDGGIITNIYDGEDRLITTVNQDGKETANVYDAAGRLIRKSDAEKNTTYYEYDAVGNVIKTIDPNGGTTLNTYDAGGNLLTTADSLGNVTSYQYNAFSKPVQITNAMNGATVNEYTVSGDLLSVTDQNGNTTRFAYDCFGNKISSTDANGNKTVYAYDENNNLCSVTDALCNTTSYVYDCNNRLTAITDALNHTTSYGYDVLGRQTSVTDAKGNTITKTYDANDNVLTVTDAKGKVQSAAEYDINNKATAVTDASGNITTNDYDSLGNLSVTTDALGNSQSYAYDNNGKMISSVNQDGKQSTVGFDANGNLLSMTGTLGGAVNYTYNSVNKVTSESTTYGGTVSYTYNALNLKESLTNARNQSTTFTYDAAGRVTGYTSPEGTASYTYDANGNVLTATDQSGTITREYDALNRVTKYTDVNGRTVQYRYDNAGNLSQLIYPDNTSVYYTYDENNKLVKDSWWSMVQPNTSGVLPLIDELPTDGEENIRVVAYAYDENNNVIGVTKPDGSVTTNTYDDAQRIVSTVERKADNTIIVGYAYSYDALGRVTSETDMAANKRSDYIYDNLSRVLTKTVTDLSTNESSAESFTYDDAGNISSCTVSDGANTFVYDTNNRLTSFNGQAVSYDADGNMLNANGVTYTYDSANRLISAGGNSYTYDVENVRVRNLCADSDTSYTYNTNAKMSQLLWAQQSDGTVTKYVYALGLVGEETGGNFKTYHYDYRGSTTAITDKDGNITDSFTYDTYGKVISRTGTTDTPFLYNGKDGVMTDSNGLFYMRARYYNPTLKRFVNADIIVGELTNSATLNRYAYANGNPVSNVDPFGLSADESRGVTKNTNTNYGLAFEWSKMADPYFVGDLPVQTLINRDTQQIVYNSLRNSVLTAVRPNNIPVGVWAKQIDSDLKWIDDVFGKTSNLAKGVKFIPFASVALDSGFGIYENIQNNAPTQKIVSDAVVDVGFGLGGIGASTVAGTTLGSIVPGAGNVAGAAVGFVAGVGYYVLTDVITINEKSAIDWAKDGAGWISGKVVGWFD